jgi:prevent-host-death family protein
VTAVTEIGAYEAKTHLPQLLERVLRGERILITRHGKPTAMLVPAAEEDKDDVREVIAKMKALRRGNTLPKGMSIRDMIEEGRRF